jgi:tetrahydromethanopterin S-methyltransferase subunit H
MFGPIENCEGIATAAAFSDIVLTEAYRELGGDLGEGVTKHPILSLV